MVYLGPANHLRDAEQATILPPKAGLSEGSPGGASCVVMWPLLWIPHLTDPPLRAAAPPEDAASALAFSGPLLNPS